MYELQWSGKRCHRDRYPARLFDSRQRCGGSDALADAIASTCDLSVCLSCTCLWKMSRRRSHSHPLTVSTCVCPRRRPANAAGHTATVPFCRCTRSTVRCARQCGPARSASATTAAGSQRYRAAFRVAAAMCGRAADAAGAAGRHTGSRGCRCARRVSVLPQATLWGFRRTAGSNWRKFAVH